MRELKMPDITPAQIAAILGVVLGPLVAFGLLDDAAAQTLVASISGAVSAVLMVADAVIRNGRSKIAAAKQGIELADSVVADD